jgi:predicted CXXCH cytochrome family protein
MCRRAAGSDTPVAPIWRDVAHGHEPEHGPPALRPPPGKRLRTLGAVLPLLLILEAASAAADTPPPAHVGSAACTDCHAAEAAAWAASDHALAWTAPSETTVLGNFDNATFEHGGHTTRFFRQDGRFFIETDGRDGVRRAYEVVGVAGIDPLQQYLLSPEPGRTQVYDIAWHVDASRWYPVFPGASPPPGDGFHWTGPYKSWEARCAECHATGYRRNYEPGTRAYAPEMVEKGVGCEACHGPGASHVAWAADPATPVTPGLARHGLTVDLAASAGDEIWVCAPCHSRREAFADGLPTPGTNYHDAYSLALLREGLYHADGSILDEVFETGSFLQSKMYARGVRCTDCHEPHSGRLRAEGNAVCSQCHGPAGNPRFPTLPAALYDDPSHHFHAPGSEGAQCAACHMIARTYMGVDDRRDHAFRIPRPDLALEILAPNTCNACHTDRSAAWAAAEIAVRFPDSRHRGAHFATTLAAARWSTEAQAGALLALAADTDAAGIIRATALELLVPVADPARAAQARPLLTDADPLVRAAAASVQRGAPAAQRLAHLLPALEDPVRAVRIAAAKAMLEALSYPPSAEAAVALQAALADWAAALSARADFPETHLQIGGAALTSRNWPLAISAFREAVALDPQLVDAWAMLVRVLEAVGDEPAADRARDAAREANPAVSEP